MNNNQEMSKIKSTHLERDAYIYIRQSSVHQVLLNTGSTARQYNLAARAREYGWAPEKIIVVDQDQGLSGTSTEGRNGFKMMLAEITLGRVGAIFCLEASRLARDSSDWHQLIKMCALTNTLVIDENGIHNPRAFDDRLLLSIKGILSDVDLHFIMSRLHGARLEKAKNGTYRFGLPVGYVYDPAGNIIMDPNPKVQQIVRLFFDQFHSLGSAMAVLRYFTQHNLKFPTRWYDGGYHIERKMGPMNYTRVLKHLHNPIYAGMYVYGRSRTELYLPPGDTLEVTARRVLVPPDEWPIVLPDSHEGYITEEQFWQNLRRLAENREDKEKGTRGVARHGSALLQGIVRCGVCGRGMSVKYPTKHRRPIYQCLGARQSNGTGHCQFVSAERVDKAITKLIFQAVMPTQIEVSLNALSQMDAQVRMIREQWQLRLTQAKNEAELIGRLYKQTARENGQVARKLEADWEKALEEVDSVKKEESSLPIPPSHTLSAEGRDEVLSLAQDLPTVWHASTTEHKDRKEVTRLLIKDLILLREPELIRTTIRWQTGARTEVEIPWLSFPDSHRTASEVIDLIREMTPTNTDHVIAEQLNKLGFVPRWQDRFDAYSIKSIRDHHKIPSGCWERYPPGFEGPRGDGRYSARRVAKMMASSLNTVIEWCKEGKLDAIRSTPTSPWWIKIAPEDIPTLRTSLRSRSSYRLRLSKTL